jgi:hypothetical protein
MRDRLKILDCNRKNILGLPDGALKLWLTYYMNEDDDNESWISIPKIEAQTGMGRTSIVKWTAFLRKNEWLIDTGKTAADKLLARGRMPSSNAHQVKAYRVDDPTSSKNELLTSSEVELKVYSYGSGSGSASNPLQVPLGVPIHSESNQQAKSGSPLGEIKATPKPKPKTQTPRESVSMPNGMGTKSEPKEEKPKTKKPRAFPDGVPWPKNFDRLTNAERTELILAHTPPPQCQAILDDGSDFCKEPSVGKHQQQYRNGKYGDWFELCAHHMRQARQRDYERSMEIMDRLEDL